MCFARGYAGDLSSLGYLPAFFPVIEAVGISHALQLLLENTFIICRHIWPLLIFIIFTQTSIP